MEKKNDLLDLTFEFALDIIDFTELLESLKKYVLARQLMKSGTSIGANSREAQSAESLVDFIHRLKIAAKESEKRNIGSYSANTQKITLIHSFY